MDYISKIKKEYPILRDSNFRESYPNIDKVAGVLYFATKKGTKNLRAFNAMGIGSFQEYLDSLHRGDMRSKDFYNQLDEVISSLKTENL